MKTSLLIFFTAFILTGCFQDPEIDFKKPEMQVPSKPVVVKRNKGSLYTVKGPSLFADKKDLQVGDIIQVQVSESMTSNTNNSRETTSDRNASLGGGVATAGTAGGTAERVAKFLNPITNLGFDTTSTSANKGEVKTKLNETFSASVSAVIEETYANGNYFIKGFKEMMIDGQKQSLTLTGVIRPYDITADNTITSNQVANLKVLYEKDGEEQDVMHLPIGWQLLKLFWPF